MIACFKAICFVCGGVSEGVVYIAMDDCIYVWYYFFCIEGLMNNVLFFYTDHVLLTQVLWKNRYVQYVVFSQAFVFTWSHRKALA